MGEVCDIKGACVLYRVRGAQANLQMIQHLIRNIYKVPQVPGSQ